MTTKDTIQLIKSLYPEYADFIPLHPPVFFGNERKYLNDCIDTTFVSSVGQYVDRMEQLVAEYTGAAKAVVCVNGTNALYMSLLLAGVKQGDEVITQALTFIATANAISYLKYLNLEKNVDNIKINGNRLTGEINSNKDGMLFLSIPYDEKFEIYVDGIEVDYYSLLDGTFIGLDINVGEHDIELKYVDNNFKWYIVITIVSIVITIILYYFINNRVIKRKGLEKLIEEEKLNDKKKKKVKKKKK